MVDEVDRATRVRGDHRQAGRVRLLHRLAERLLGAGVHEHVHGGVRGGELAAAHAAEPRDGHARERAAGGRLARAVARDEEAHAADPAEGLEPLELLLGGDAPHVADDGLAARRDAVPERDRVLHGAVAGVVAVEVDAAPPAGDALDARRREVGGRGAEGARVRSAPWWIHRTSRHTYGAVAASRFRRA